MNSGLFRGSNKVTVSSPVSCGVSVTFRDNMLLLAAKDEDQRVRVCADHLRRYNEGLKLSNTIRMCDALSFLEEFYEEELKKKTAPDEEHFIQITDAERFLFNLFQGTEVVFKTMFTSSRTVLGTSCVAGVFL